MTRVENTGKATAWLASGTLISRITGFISAAILVGTIGGVGDGTNAFALANSLPNNIYLLIAGGVLNAVLVPQIVRAARSHDGGLAYINKLVTLSLVLLAAATIILTLASPVVVSIYGFKQIGTPIIGLAIAFSFWCMPQIFFYGMYTVLGEVLNARKMFGPFTWAPVLNNVVAIAGMFLYVTLFGSDPSGLLPISGWDSARIAVIAGTATLGVMCQAIVLVLFWKRAGLTFQWDFNWRGVGLRSAGRASSGALGIMVVGQIAFIITMSTVLGVGAGDASVRVLTLSYLIFVLPHSIITVSITTAHFTKMSENAAINNFPAVRDGFSTIVRSASLPIVLAMFGIIVLSMPVSRIFIKDPTQVGALALVIIGQTAALVFFTLIFISQRTFYSLGNTRVPFIFFTIQYGVQSIVVFVAGATVPKEYLAFSLALAQGIGMLAAMPIALYWLKKKLGTDLDGGRILRSIALFLAAGTISAIIGFVVTNSMGGYATTGFGSTLVGSLITIAIVAAIMSVVYVALLWVFRSQDLRAAAAPILRRLKR